MARTIQIDEQITVGNLAELLALPASKLIAELFKNGILATINEKIDFDTAQIVVAELALDVELTKKDRAPLAAKREKQTLSNTAEPRPPVVAMMGHIDHGKTSLLDAIRQSEIAGGEAGGITQHLSAYQIEHEGRLMTFLDTPGHEAFAALREHGARLTDVAIIVVAADEGIKPQTVEAIRFARGAGVKMIVAANKMDRPGANIDRLKQQLAENDLTPEDWGGETIIMPVSAKTKEGITELVDMILLVSDVEDLRAETKGPAEGIVIESHMEKGRGPIAVALVEQGILKSGDFLTVGGTSGKIRNLESTSGRPLKQAGPSTPVIISGLKSLPDFGDEFYTVISEKIAREKAKTISDTRRSGGVITASSSSELLRIINRTDKLNELNIVVKTDVQGSLISVVQSLKTLDTDEVASRVVGSGIGVINESDIHLASTSGAIIYGFHTNLPSDIKRLALRDRVPIRLYSVIYELLDDVKVELEKLLAPEIIEKQLGELLVKGIFKTTRTETICGGEVLKGKMALPALARARHDKEIIADNIEIVGLKRGPQDVKEVIKGELCGINLKTTNKLNIAEGDRIELFTRETKTRTL
jgi:translation initiation factor IF-2